MIEKPGRVDENKISIYRAFITMGKVIDENELFKKISFSKHGNKYSVFISKSRATKATHIECRPDNTIYWVQFYPFGAGRWPSRVENVLIKPINHKDETTLIVIKGKPGIITGLDEGIFVSSRGIPKSNNSVYVMSEGDFKLFEIQ